MILLKFFIITNLVLLEKCHEAYLNSVCDYVYPAEFKVQVMYAYKTYFFPEVEVVYSDLLQVML